MRMGWEENPGSPESKQGTIPLKDEAACHLADCDTESHCHMPWAHRSQRASPRLSQPARSAVRNWRKRIWQRPEGIKYLS